MFIACRFLWWLGVTIISFGLSFVADMSEPTFAFGAVVMGIGLAILLFADVVLARRRSSQNQVTA
jgi:hypothetical protein